MKHPIFLRTALYNRGRTLMRSYLSFVDFFGNGDIELAEKCFSPMVSKRRRAMRIVNRLHRA